MSLLPDVGQCQVPKEQKEDTDETTRFEATVFAKLEQLQLATEQLQNRQELLALSLAGAVGTLPSSGLSKKGIDEAKPSLIQAQQPKVTTFSKVVEFTYIPGTHAATVTFEHQPDGIIYELNLRLRACSTSRTSSLMGSVTTTNGACFPIQAYFIYMRFMKDDKPTNVDKWLVLRTSNKIISYQGEYRCKNFGSFESAQCNFLHSYELERVSIDKPKIILQLSAMYYDTTASDRAVPQPFSSKEKIAKLVNLKGQLNSKVAISAANNVPNPASVAIHTMFLRDCSPVFETLFDPKRPALYPFTAKNMMSSKSLNTFYNWVYGMDAGVWLDDIQMNLELLEFGLDFMISDLIQICVDNLCKTPVEHFTISLLEKVWKFGEDHRFPELEDCVYEWIKKKSGISLDGCMPWK